MFGTKKRLEEKLDIIIKLLRDMEKPFIPAPIQDEIDDGVIFMDDKHEKDIQDALEENQQ